MTDAAINSAGRQGPPEGIQPPHHATGGVSGSVSGGVGVSDGVGMNRDAAAASAEPGQRGSLKIADRVVEKIATAAAAEVDGVQRSTASGIDGAFEDALGRALPKASATVAGNHVTVRLQIETVWPLPLAQTAKTVRDHVRERLTFLVGFQVDRVDVTIAKVSAPQPQQQRRVE